MFCNIPLLFCKNITPCYFIKQKRNDRETNTNTTIKGMSSSAEIPLLLNMKDKFSLLFLELKAMIVENLDRTDFFNLRGTSKIWRAAVDDFMTLKANRTELWYILPMFPQPHPEEETELAVIQRIFPSGDFNRWKQQWDGVMVHRMFTDGVDIKLGSLIPTDFTMDSMLSPAICGPLPVKLVYTIRGVSYCNTSKFFIWPEGGKAGVATVAQVYQRTMGVWEKLKKYEDELNVLKITVCPKPSGFLLIHFATELVKNKGSRASFNPAPYGAFIDGVWTDIRDDTSDVSDAEDADDEEIEIVTGPFAGGAIVAESGVGWQNEEWYKKLDNADVSLDAYKDSHVFAMTPGANMSSTPLLPGAQAPRVNVWEIEVLAREKLQLQTQ